MAYSEELLRKKLEDSLFSLRLYEIYSRKMPSDAAVAELCEKYKKLISTLSEECALKYGFSTAEENGESELI